MSEDMIKKILLIFFAGMFLLSAGCGKKAANVPAIYADFEDPKVWDISPEHGFKLSRSKKYVTQGKFSLKVVYPKRDLPSINTKQLKQTSADYEYLIFDVYNPQKETLDFTVRLDDTSRARGNFKRPLKPGWNAVKISCDEIDNKIEAAALYRVVLFLNDPRKRYTLYFDNMRLESAENKQASGKDVKKNDVRGRLPAVDMPAVPQLPDKGILPIGLERLKDNDGGTVLISTGIPFAPGQLMDEKRIAFFDGARELAVAVKVLARWPRDNSIRSVLVQFEIAPDEIGRILQMRWGSVRAAVDRPIVPVTWEVPEGIILLPPAWLCASGVVGAQVPMSAHPFARYERHIKEHFPPSLKPWERPLYDDIYYDTAHVMYQLYARSGKSNYFILARRYLTKYRDKSIVMTDGADKGSYAKRSQTRYVYVEALCDDYLLTGDERSLTVAKAMTDYSVKKFPPKKAFYPKHSRGFWTEREAAFPLLGVVAYYEMTGDPAYLDIAAAYMANLHRTQREWPERGGFIHNLYAHDPEEGARRNEYGGSPFMTGLLLEGIIRYHKITEDPVAAESLLMALEWLKKECLTSGGKSFYYMTCRSQKSEGGHPDLNLLIAHAFGYGYDITRNKEYRALGKQIFQAGVANAYLKDIKHFNQNYRSSGHFLGYLYGMKETEKLIEALTAQTRTAAVVEKAPPIPSERMSIAEGGKGVAPPPHVEKQQNVSQVLLPPQKRRLEALLKAKDMLYYEGFERSAGVWKAGNDTQLARSSDIVYADDHALCIASHDPTIRFSAGFRGRTWQLAAYPRLSFAYKIPAGLSVALRFSTQFGDWLCLGGTPSHKHAKGDLVNDAYVLIDDDQWHEIVIEVETGVHAVFAGLEFLNSFQLYAHPKKDVQGRFWVDEILIYE